MLQFEIKTYVFSSKDVEVYYQVPERVWPAMDEFENEVVRIEFFYLGNLMWQKKYNVLRLPARNSFGNPIDFISEKMLIATVGSKVIVLENSTGKDIEIFNCPTGFIHSVKAITETRFCMLFNRAWRASYKVAMLSLNGEIEWERDASYSQDDSFINLRVEEKTIILQTWNSYLIHLDLNGNELKRINIIK